MRQTQPGQSRRTRRNFLKHAAAGAAAAAAGPNILARAAETKGGKPVTVGSGEHTFEWIENWAELPGGKQFGYTHAVCEVEDGRIFVHNMSPDAVAIFDPDGKFIESWGEEYAAGAHGMDYSKEDGEEFLYLAPTGQHFVAKTTLDGEVVFKLDYPKESGLYEDAAQYVPTNIAILPSGDFYVADGYGLSYIHQYSKDGEYVRSWGGKGAAHGQLDCPHGIYVDTRHGEPRLIVADRSNVRFQYFSLDGEYMGVMSENLLHPCHFDQHGEEMLVPDLFGRISLFDKNDNLITHLGAREDPKSVEGWPNIAHDQRTPGEFSSPHGACWDRAGNIFVAEWINDGRVTKLRRV